jgi:hypothetical protein
VRLRFIHGPAGLGGWAAARSDNTRRESKQSAAAECATRKDEKFIYASKKRLSTGGIILPATGGGWQEKLFTRQFERWIGLGTQFAGMNRRGLGQARRVARWLSPGRNEKAAPGLGAALLLLKLAAGLEGIELGQPLLLFLLA